MDLQEMYARQYGKCECVCRLWRIKTSCFDNNSRSDAAPRRILVLQSVYPKESVVVVNVQGL